MGTPAINTSSAASERHTDHVEERLNRRHPQLSRTAYEAGSRAAREETILIEFEQSRGIGAVEVAVPIERQAAGFES